MKKYNFDIAKKIAKNENLTSDEQKFVDEYVEKLLKECFITYNN